MLVIDGTQETSFSGKYDGVQTSLDIGVLIKVTPDYCTVTFTCESIEGNINEDSTRSVACGDTEIITGEKTKLGVTIAEGKYTSDISSPDVIIPDTYAIKVGV
jgi:hypothetical protein